MPEYAIGVDIGGTKIASVLIDQNGKPIAKIKRPTQPDRGVDSVLDRVVDCVRELMESAEHPVAGIGVGVAGSVDYRRATVILAGNLGWENVPIEDLLVERLGAAWKGRIRADVDVIAAAVGEQFYGGGRGSDHLLCVTVGTGIGVGLILNGRPYHGSIGGSGNFGHFILDPDGERCGCGKRGCLETLASGPAIARRAVASLNQGEKSALSGIDSAAITAVEVVRAAREGDEMSRRILAEAGRYLGIALAYCADLLNPERIIIGGGLRAAGDLLLGPVRATFDQWAIPAIASYTRIILSELDDAAAIGAGAFVWMNNDPA